MNISNCAFLNNSDTEGFNVSGLGINNTVRGNLTLDNSVFSGNSGNTVFAGNGGAIRNDGTATITKRSQISECCRSAARLSRTIMPFEAADFDGDGKADLTVYRSSAGAWYRLNSSNGQFVSTSFGIAEDKTVVADYDGDGKTDIAVFRPANGTWYQLCSTSGLAAQAFGANGDIPTPNAFVR